MHTLGFYDQSIIGRLPDPFSGLPPSVPLEIGRVLPADAREALAAIRRGDFNQDLDGVGSALQRLSDFIERAITTSTSNWPVRENLDAEVAQMTPIDTPVRNMLPRTVGNGLAAKWKLITSLGGGYGHLSTVTSGASSTTQTLGSTAGLQVGDSIYFVTSNAFRIVTAVNSATEIVVNSSISTTTSEVTMKGPNFQPNGGAAAQYFFPETGAPESLSTIYAEKTAAYKIMGTLFELNQFVQAAGANFQNNRVRERMSAMQRLMLMEEHALIAGSSTVVAKPWGNGTTNYAFNGLLNLVTTANGCPSDQVQTSVGALTKAHIDAQLTRLWVNGGTGMFMLVNAQEANSLNKIWEGIGVNRIMFANPDGVTVGERVSKYVHPVSGQEVRVIVSRFIPAGTILFGCERTPDGKPTAEVDVLPVAELPEISPGQQIQGYTAQEIAPTVSTPLVQAGIIFVFEVLKLRSAVVFAKSTGVTPAA